MTTLCPTRQNLLKKGMVTLDSGNMLSSHQLSDPSGMALAAASSTATFFMYLICSKGEKKRKILQLRRTVMNMLTFRALWEIAKAAVGPFRTPVLCTSVPFSLSWVRIPRVDLLIGMLCLNCILESAFYRTR